MRPDPKEEVNCRHSVVLTDPGWRRPIRKSTKRMPVGWCPSLFPSSRLATPDPQICGCARLFPEKQRSNNEANACSRGANFPLRVRWSPQYLDPGLSVVRIRAVGGWWITGVRLSRGLSCLRKVFGICAYYVMSLCVVMLFVLHLWKDV